MEAEIGPVKLVVEKSKYAPNDILTMTIEGHGIITSAFLSQHNSQPVKDGLQEVNDMRLKIVELEGQVDRLAEMRDRWRDDAKGLLAENKEHREKLLGLGVSEDVLTERESRLYREGIELCEQVAKLERECAEQHQTIKNLKQDLKMARAQYEATRTTAFANAECADARGKEIEELKHTARLARFDAEDWRGKAERLQELANQHERARQQGWNEANEWKARAKAMVESHENTERALASVLTEIGKTPGDDPVFSAIEVLRALASEEGDKP